MKLARAQISGYRSISNNIDFHVDPQVTVLLGANDHGKTNILEALAHVNGDLAFDSERDLNWDHSTGPEEFPDLEFEFELDASDREALLEEGQKIATKEAAAAEDTAAKTQTSTAAEAPVSPGDPDPSAAPEPSATLARIIHDV